MGEGVAMKNYPTTCEAKQRDIPPIIVSVNELHEQLLRLDRAVKKLEERSFDSPQEEIQDIPYDEVIRAQLQWSAQVVSNLSYRIEHINTQL